MMAEVLACEKPKLCHRASRLGVSARPAALSGQNVRDSGRHQDGIASQGEIDPIVARIDTVNGQSTDAANLLAKDYRKQGCKTNVVAQPIVS
jgi:hypothetical protein